MCDPIFLGMSVDMAAGVASGAFGAMAVQRWDEKRRIASAVTLLVGVLLSAAIRAWGA